MPVSSAALLFGRRADEGIGMAGPFCGMRPSIPQRRTSDYPCRGCIQELSIQDLDTESVAYITSWPPVKCEAMSARISTLR